MINLFEKVEEAKRINKEAYRINKELGTILSKQLIELPYKMEKVEVAYENGEQKEEVYYPVLELPEGFTKENEVFYREYVANVAHEYTLKDNKGKDIKIKEVSQITCKPYSRLAIGEILLKFNITSRNICYIVDICDKQYKFARELKSIDMLGQIMDINEVAKYSSNDTSYIEAEKAYEEFCKRFGDNTEIISLYEIFRTSKAELQISPNVIAQISIGTLDSNKGEMYFESDKFNIKLFLLMQVRVTIELQPYFDTDIKLEKQTYRFSMIVDNKEEYTLKQAIELFE